MRIDVDIAQAINPLRYEVSIRVPYILATYRAEIGGKPYECRIAFDRETPYQRVREIGDAQACHALRRAAQEAACP